MQYSVRRCIETVALCLSLALFSSGVQAELTQVQHNGLTLRGDFEMPAGADIQGDEVYLIVHGTWAHHEMEIVQSLQEVLLDYDQSSLAITLSLGRDDRQGFLPCEGEIIARHEAAIAEIDVWFAWLIKQGFGSVHLVGHSRGGNQVLLYSAAQTLARSMPSSISQAYRQPASLILLAPMNASAENLAASYADKFGLELAPLLEQARSAGNGLIEAGAHHCDHVRIQGDSFRSYYGPLPVKESARLLSTENLPVVVFVGTKDPLGQLLLDDAHLFNHRSNVSLRVVDGADHFFRDLYMDEVVESMLKTSSP